MQALCNFDSFVMGGFEASAHLLQNGRRLDIIAATCHDKFAHRDYAQLRGLHIRTVRDALRWHLIETRPGVFDFGPDAGMLKAAADHGMQVIWDLLHYGWPEFHDVFSEDFPKFFADFCAAFAAFHRREYGNRLHVCPVNEISFLAWGGAEVACLNPYVRGRGSELKAQLVRSTLLAVDAIRAELPETRIVHVDPAIHVAATPGSTPEWRERAEEKRRLMFQAWDMLSGRSFRELGGDPSYVDIIGVNFYVHNQWILDGPSIFPGHSLYRPLHRILEEIHQRYQRPLFIAETGIEDDLRADWFTYVSHEVMEAHRIGVPVEGVCLYPILNHPGWSDERHCYNGLLDYCSEEGERSVYRPLALEVERQSELLLQSWNNVADVAPQNATANWGLTEVSTEDQETAMNHLDNDWTLPASGDLLCLSHLRWGFVYQRPQHLLSRFARSGRRVFFVEEPIFAEGTSRMDVRLCPHSGVTICVPHIPHVGPESTNTIQKLLLSNLIADYQIQDYTLWYYTPMALEFSRHLSPRVTVFDCMDELSAFAGAPPEMKEREAEMLRRADVVFTGGMSLYEAKLGRHDDLHCFPSSVDVPHFAKARTRQEEPADQAGIPHPRLGFAGVIDERMDIELLRQIATLRPDWHFVMLGPVVKIDPQALPHNENIHYVGGKSYDELPAYMAGWDVALLPFAHNDSTRFISPTKTPEYLSAGKPVVSTSITDVVRPYGVSGMVRIADKAEEFVQACEMAMSKDANDPQHWQKIDDFLSGLSWDATWQQMHALIEAKAKRRRMPVSAVQPAATLHSAVSGD